MAKKKLRVGVIGCGDIARSMHLPNWQELEAEGRIEFIGACDLIEQRAKMGVERFGARKSYLDFKKMLRDNEFDIVDICTQNRGHAPITIAALNSGANVLVEKPMAMNSREGIQMLDAAKKNRRKLMVAQHMRFEAPSEALKHVIENGQLGQIYTANAMWLRKRGIPGWGKFHIAKESLGGPLIDIGVHMMDLCVWLMGSPKPKSVSGKVYCKFGDREDLCNADWGRPYKPKEFDVEDYCTAMVRFEKDITMLVEVSWAANIPAERYHVSVLGDKAGVSTNPLGVFGYNNGSLVNTTFDWLPKQEGHRMEIRHFTECIEKNLPVRVKPEESVQIMKIIDAIYESSKKNKEILIK